MGSVPLLASLLATMLGTPTDWRPREGAELIGTRAPEWTGLVWLQGGPVTLAETRGRPVLIRFWTVGCPLCTATAPALAEMHDRYGDRGLLVVGIHHPKSEQGRELDVVRASALELGMRFPVAQDEAWSTVRAHGVGTRFRSFTSVTILVGPDGRIRFVHDGGEWHRGGGRQHADCRAAFAAIEHAIEALLPPPDPSSSR